MCNLRACSALKNYKHFTLLIESGQLCALRQRKKEKNNPDRNKKNECPKSVIVGWNNLGSGIVPEAAESYEWNRLLLKEKCRKSQHALIAQGIKF